MQQLIDQLVSKDVENVDLLHLGHSMVIIVESSRVLRKCYEEEQYGSIEKLKEVE